MGESVTALAYTAADVSAFARCVGWPAGHGVPPTFPIRLMMEAAAPFMRRLDAVMRERGVKLVHATQTVSLLSPLPEAARVSVKVTTGDIPEAGAKERRLSVAAEVSGEDGGALATLKSGLMLLPELPTGGGKTVEVPADAVEMRFSEADLAAYANASLDFNPIHTDPAAARALGLPRPVVHGMLLLGRAASVAQDRIPDRPVGAIDCLFLSPVLAGDRVRVAVELPAGARNRFQIIRGDGALAVSGSVRPPA
jgi:acyl dehydratase